MNIRNMESMNLDLRNIDNTYTYLEELNRCEKLLLGQVITGQAILLVSDGDIDGDKLISLRLNNSKLNQLVQSLQGESFSENGLDDDGIVIKIAGFYDFLDAVLLQKLFNREVVDPITVSSQINSEFDRLDSSLDAFRWEVREYSQDISMAAADVLRRFRISIFIIFFIFLVFMIGFLIHVKQNLIDPINITAEKMGNLVDGGGHLDFRFDYKQKDEIGMLASNFDRFLENLEAMIREISSVGSLSRETGLNLDQEIRINRDLSSGFIKSTENLKCYFGDLEKTFLKASEVAAAAQNHSDYAKDIGRNQEIMFSESVENMKNMIQDVSKNREKIEETFRITAVLLEKSESGLKIINSLNEQIDEVSSVTHDIKAINEVVHDLADRTNILSINTAIEASRGAGSGAGFKVVAGEIKSLSTEVKVNADMIFRNLQESINTVEKLKVESESGKEKFTEIKREALKVHQRMKSMVNSLIVQEAAGNVFLDSINDLKISNSEILDTLFGMSQILHQIGRSIENLSEDLSPALDSIDEVQRGALDLGRSGDNLSVIGRNNQTTLRILSGHIEHFAD
ncbi:MAG: methyl-accepting chemotaxis protein [Spirochaetales bacterium]|nr:methyl-accepting chemotaxis protein [Spirochaetales bacterium]